MQQPEPSSISPSDSDGLTSVSENDIVFNCPHCGGELVVDKEGEGMVFDCSHCGAEIMIPPYSGPSTRRRELELQKTVSESIDQALPKEIPPVPIPDLSDQTDEALVERLGQLRLQYKENLSQRTEVRGHINRNQIELHRQQLKLQKLVERQMQMEAELTAIQQRLPKAASSDQTSSPS